MITISEQEMFRRLKLIRDIRLCYVEKYGIQKDELGFGYSLLDRLNEAEYVEVDSEYQRRLRYGKYKSEKTVTHWDAAKDALYNRGEVQGYWGDTEIIHGTFKTEIGSIIVAEEVLSADCTDQRIREIERKEFEGFLRTLKYSLNQDISFRVNDLDKLTKRISEMKERLWKLEEITID